MLGWAIAAVAVVGIFMLMSRVNQRTCALAFVRGGRDAERPFETIVATYRGYLSPLRPMDAAAYRMGVEYVAQSIFSQAPADPRAAFMDAWRSKRILQEGGEIRRDPARDMAPLRLVIDRQAMEAMQEDPSLSPMEAMMRVLDEAKES